MSDLLKAGAVIFLLGNRRNKATAGKAPPGGLTARPTTHIPGGRLPNTIPQAGSLGRADGLALYMRQDDVAAHIQEGQRVLGEQGSFAQQAGTGFLTLGNLELPKAPPGAESAVRQAKEQGQLLEVCTMHDLLGIARMIAGGAVVQQSATKPVLTGDLRNWLKTARTTIVFGDACKVKICQEMARNLHAIGGITTDGWKPGNHGLFAHGENKYTVPSDKSEAEIMRLLLNFDAVDFAFELAKAEAINAAMRVTRGETNGAARVIAGVAKLAGEVAGQAVAGLKAGGPWGALIGAIKGALESAFNQAFKGIADALEKLPKENRVLGELARAFAGMEALVGGVRYPVEDLGFGMNIPNQDIPRDIEISSDFNQWFQRAGQNNIAGSIFSFGAAPSWVPQGVYPGPAKQAYRSIFGGLAYAWTTDGDDDMSPYAWDRAPGFPVAGGGKVSP